MTEEMNELELLGIEPEGPPSPGLLELRARIAARQHRLKNDPLSFLEGPVRPIKNAGVTGYWNCWACNRRANIASEATFIVIENGGTGHTGLCSACAAEYRARH